MPISRTFAERLLFLPERLGSTVRPVVSGIRAHDLWLTAEDGTRIHSWLFEVRGKAPIVILFHGNAGHIGHRIPLAAGLVSRQLSVLLVDYRGYGRSEGRPSEPGLYLDGEAAYRLAVDRLGSGRNLVLFGRSLGAAVATHVAARREVGCLILEAPFTSVDEIASAVYTFLPSFLFRRLRGRLDTLTEIAQVSSPVLVIHGTRDRIVPIRRERRSTGRLRSAEPGSRWRAQAITMCTTWAGTTTSTGSPASSSGPSLTARRRRTPRTPRSAGVR